MIKRKTRASKSPLQTSLVEKQNNIRSMNKSWEEIVGKSSNMWHIFNGDSVKTLLKFPDGSINCTITSPPYWGQRDYDTSNAIGLENEFDIYLKRLLAIFDQVHRVTTDDGSLWLNMGDRYVNKNMLGMPWRVALALRERGWVLRQDIIWDKIRLTQSAKDRLRTVHEYVFHFTKKAKYYYDRSSIVIKHTERPRMVNGRIRSITGVSGVKYENEIRTSKYLTKKEKTTAMNELKKTLNDMASSKILDFRMYVRGRPRIYNGNNANLSGRAKEIKDKGFFIKTHKPDGDLPTNIWRMVPEDIHREDAHCAVYPVALMELPIKATCPLHGIVLDPFAGTGTSVISALKHGRRAIGIDISPAFSKVAKSRITKYLKTGLEC